jgi:hypothetical protein
MIKHALAVVAFVALNSTAFAAQWSVSEASAAGIKSYEGTWTLTTDGAKVTGKADLQNDKGALLNYKIEGEVAGDVYTLKLVDRTDGKKNCVWTGKQAKTVAGHGVAYDGEVACDGSKFAIRAGVN